MQVTGISSATQFFPSTASGELSPSTPLPEDPGAPTPLPVPVESGDRTEGRSDDRLERLIERVGQRIDRFEHRVQNEDGRGRRIMRQIKGIEHAVRDGLREIVREARRSEDDAEQTRELRQELRAAYKSFRFELRDAFREAHRGYDVNVDQLSGALRSAFDGLVARASPALAGAVEVGDDEAVAVVADDGDVARGEGSGAVTVGEVPALDPQGGIQAILDSVGPRIEALIAELAELLAAKRGDGATGSFEQSIDLRIDVAVSFYAYSSSSYSFEVRGGEVDSTR